MIALWVRIVLFILIRRIKQKNITPLAQLLKSLEKCASLVQLSLIFPSKAAPNLLARESNQKDQALALYLEQFVRCLPKLNEFYMALSQPATHCSVAIRRLSRIFQFERPAFCCAIVNLPDLLNTVRRLPNPHGPLPTLQSLERPSLPSVHTEFLYDCNSKVCDLPYCATTKNWPFAVRVLSYQFPVTWTLECLNWMSLCLTIISPFWKFEKSEK